jgi:hypothetical protein
MPADCGFHIRAGMGIVMTFLAPLGSAQLLHQSSSDRTASKQSEWDATASDVAKYGITSAQVAAYANDGDAPGRVAAEIAGGIVGAADFGQVGAVMTGVAATAASGPDAGLVGVVGGFAVGALLGGVVGSKAMSSYGANEGAEAGIVVGLATQANPEFSGFSHQTASVAGFTWSFLSTLGFYQNTAGFVAQIYPTASNFVTPVVRVFSPVGHVVRSLYTFFRAL